MQEENTLLPLYGKLALEGIIRLKSGLHIGGNSMTNNIGNVDSTVIRDPFSSQPIIPGSSLKGKLRYLLTRYFVNDERDSTIITRLFGSSSPEYVRSRLQFCDLKLNPHNVKKFEQIDTDLYLTEIKFENKINIDGEANPRQIERVPAGSEFDFHLIYNIEALDEVEDDLEVLKKGLNLLRYDYLGGSGSRGYGRIAFSELDLFSLLDTENTQNEINAKIELLISSFEELTEP